MVGCRHCAWQRGSQRGVLAGWPIGWRGHAGRRGSARLPGMWACGCCRVHVLMQAVAPPGRPQRLLLTSLPRAPSPLHPYSA